MESYSNKINQIKFTIEEIRNDIEKMKLKNENVINTMMTSINPIDNKHNDIQEEITDSHQIYSDNENEDINAYIPKDNYIPSQYNQDIQYENNNPLGTVRTLPDEHTEELHKKYETYDSNRDYYSQMEKIKDSKNNSNNNIKVYQNVELQEEEETDQEKQDKNYSLKDEYNDNNIEYISPENKKDNIVEQCDNNQIYSSNDKVNNKTQNKSPGFNFRQKETLGQKQNITPLLQYRNTEIKNNYSYENKTKNENTQNNIQKDNNNNNKDSNENNNSNSNLTILKLQQDIINLKSQLSLAQNENEILNQEVQKEKHNNELLLQSKKEQNDFESQALNNLMNYLNVSSFDQIIPKIESIISQQQQQQQQIPTQNEENFFPQTVNDKLKEELIDKLKKVYIQLSGADENKEVDIKAIWRWIKHLINSVRNLTKEKNNNIKIIQELQMSNIYRDYCEQLMNKYNINNFNELKSYVNNILNSNRNININRNIPIKKQNSNDLNKNKFY